MADLESIDLDPLLSLWRPLPDTRENVYCRVSRAIRGTGLATIFERPLLSGRQGTATVGTIVVSASLPDSRNRLATLLHEYATYFLISHQNLGEYTVYPDKGIEPAFCTFS
jgi:hypothetical protein